jgi:hypothetical protein
MLRYWIARKMKVQAGVVVWLHKIICDEMGHV